MRCPFCTNIDTQVLESRIAEDGKEIRRRRLCSHCKKRFTTYESVKKSFLWVVKKDGKREPFDKNKVKTGILKAIEKRPVSLAAVDEMVESIEREMLKKEKEEVPSRVIGSAVMRRLKKLDRVAWLRFASVYLEFENLRDFEKAIKK